MSAASTYRARASLGSRASSFLVSLALVAAVILALLWLGFDRRIPRDPGAALATFDVAAGEKGMASKSTPRPQRAREAPRAADSARPPVPVPPPTPAEPVPPLPEFLRMSRSDFAATDIGRMARAPGGGAAGAEVADAGGGETSVGEPGAAPGGATLYPAEWYREPRPAEYQPYLPPRAVVGWGMIMCRTIDRFHVEDCREMGETPGTGIARAMRQAAFQFLVRPPMVNGKPQTGTWVRIRFDITSKP